MKILLGLNKFSGSNIFGSRFISSCNHEFKILAYYKNHRYLKNINWTLDAVYSNTKKNKIIPYTNIQYINFIIDELIYWEPDLVISDAEPISATLAKLLNIPLYYCSPIFLITGVNNKNKIWQEPIKQYINNLPKADKYFIYSPLIDILPLKLKNGYEWIRPYYKDPIVQENQFSSKCITSAETSSIADCVYNNKKFILSSDNDDIEQKINSYFLSLNNASLNIGQPKSLLWLKETIEKDNTDFDLSIKNNISFLHDRISN